MSAVTTIRVNGAEEALGWASVGDLLAGRGIPPGTRGVAVALNGAVLRAADWAGTPLAAGDTVEIVRPFQGG